MTITDFLNTHYLHDSLVEKVVYENNAVELTIDFCFWMQEGYNEENPETGILRLRIPDVTHILGPIGDLDDFSILEAKYENACLTLLLMDDFNNTSYELRVFTSRGEIYVQ